MKIILTAVSPSIEAAFDQRFGRCSYFIVADTETMEWQAFPNPAKMASGGAGSQAAQFASQQNAVAVISGDFGPNAAAALNAAGIQMYLYQDGSTVKDAIERFKAAELTQVNQSTAPGHHH